MRPSLLTVAAVVVLSGLAVLAGCGSGDDLPYDANRMHTVQYDCAYRSVVRGSDAGEMQCLRDGLPKLSDEQLERLDSLIDEAGD